MLTDVEKHCCSVPRLCFFHSFSPLHFFVFFVVGVNVTTHMLPPHKPTHKMVTQQTTFSFYVFSFIIWKKFGVFSFVPVCQAFIMNIVSCWNHANPSFSSLIAEMNLIVLLIKMSWHANKSSSRSFVFMLKHLRHTLVSRPFKIKTLKFSLSYINCSPKVKHQYFPQGENKCCLCNIKFDRWNDNLKGKVCWRLQPKRNKRKSWPKNFGEFSVHWMEDVSRNIWSGLR